MNEIAIYGKGGIGKSTISANISAVFALNHEKVLQIGCDPKHDSTKLLLGDKKIMTVLEYLKNTSPEKCKLEDIVFEGFMGIHCVEAGGPEPGVGCAGRGILTTFDLLNRLGIKRNEYDLILYDVLGDVVCGGFAVPMRREYAKKIYIVTSGEFMSIYAANNILRGLQNYDGDKVRAGGLIINSRGLKQEEDRVRAFSDAVELPVIAVIPRSDLFAESEKDGKCLIEKFPDSTLSSLFFDLGAFIKDQTEMFQAKPVTDEELERIVLNRNTVFQVSEAKKANMEKTVQSEQKKQFFSKNMIQREPLHGCAFSGAIGICVQLKDSICIVHGPKSCAHIAYQAITSIGRRRLFERGIVLPKQISPPVISTDMNEGIMVYGGMQQLEDKIASAKKFAPKVIFVLTTCPSAIIGENVQALTALSDDKTKIMPICAEGNITGDFLQGVFLAYEQIINIIDKNIVPQENTVNIIGEKTLASATTESLSMITEILDLLGLKINCRLVCDTSYDEIRGFLRGKLNLFAYDDYMGRTLKEMLAQSFKIDVMDEPFPAGLKESELWLNKIAAYFGKELQAQAVINKYREIYWTEISELKPYLSGKKLMIVTSIHTIEWILQTAVDLGMEIVKVGILNYSQDNLFRSALKEHIGELVLNYDQLDRNADIARLRPDLILSNYKGVDGQVYADTIPLCPDAGFLSGIQLAKRWKEIFKLNLKEGWKQDESLFRKYFA